MRTAKKLTKLNLRMAAAVSFAIGALIFLLGPSAQVQRALGFSDRALCDRFVPLLVMAFIGLGVLSLILTTVMDSLSQEERVTGTKTDFVPLSEPRNRLVDSVSITIAAFIMLRLVFDISERAFNVDEIVSAIRFGTTIVEGVDPRQHNNHFLTSLLAAPSNFLLGVTHWGMRLPSLAFTAVLLGLMLAFGRRYLSSWATLLVVAHFSSSGFLRTIFYSGRGYVSSLALGMAVLYCYFRLAENGFQGRFRRFLYLSIVLLCLTHLLAGLFAIALLCSHLFYLYQERNRLSHSSLEKGIQTLFGIALSILPSGIFFLMHSVQITSPFHGDGVPTNWEVLQMLIGTGRDWVLRSVMLVGAATLFYFPKGKTIRTQITLFTTLLSLVGLYVSCMLAMGLKYNPPRFFVLVLLLAPLLLGQSVSQVVFRPARQGLTVALFLFMVVFPFLHQQPFITTSEGYQRSVEDFTDQVLRHAPTLAADCLETKGSELFGLALKRVYLAERPKGVSLKPCTDRYLVVFGSFRNGEEPPSVPPSSLGGTLEPLYVSPDHHTLYKISTNR